MISAIIAFLKEFFSHPNPNPITVIPLPPTPMSEPQIEPNTPPILLWDTKENIRHSIRVMCDDSGLSFNAKQIITACVYQESEFTVNPRPNQNKDPKTGKVWSTDFGIVQINDHFHIGPGKDFPSVEYVISHPKECVQWMIDMYKIGKISMWSSYLTGAYKKWLPYVNTPCPPTGYVLH